MLADAAGARVALVLPGLEYGGAETLRLALGRELATRPCRPVELLFCALSAVGAVGRELARLGYPVTALRATAHPLALATAFRLAGWLRAAEADLVHAGVVEANVLAGVAARLAGIPLVTEEAGIGGRRPWWLRALDGAAHRSAQAVVAPSETVKRWLVLRERVPAHRIRVIYNCATLRYEPLERGVVRDEVGTAADAKVVGTVARLVPEKGIDVLLRAARTVIEREPRVEVWIAGSGPERAALERLARGLGIAERVRFLGFREDVGRILSAFDVFVLASRTEGLGIALVEAALASLPCVATAVDAIPEVLRHGDSGLLVPAEDADALAASITELLRDPVNAAALGRSARRTALARFAPQRYADDVTALYSDCLAARRPGTL